MSWLVILVMAAAIFAVLALVLKAPRSGWEAIIAVLLLGLAGYAMQGRPGVEGAPHEAAPAGSGVGAFLVDKRQALAGKGVMPDPALIPADAFVRHGEYADAIGFLRKAVKQNPRNGEAWLAMGNALVAHGDGALSPAALYAFRQAEAAEPDAPGPAYFMGLAMATSGRLTEARAEWAGLLAKAPADAPWRADVANKLGRLDRLMAMAKAAGQLH